jgi:hypothetical protein
MDADLAKGYPLHITIYPAKKAEQGPGYDMGEKGIIVYLFDLEQALLQ